MCGLFARVDDHSESSRGQASSAMAPKQFVLWNGHSSSRVLLLFVAQSSCSPSCEAAHVVDATFAYIAPRTKFGVRAEVLAQLLAASGFQAF